MIVTLSLLLAAQTVLPPSPQAETEEGRAAQCQATVRRSPQQALVEANRWQAAGGGLHARQCIGLAYVALGQWPQAASTFEQGAQQAERSNDASAPDLWTQAGNAWLAASEPARALTAFDAALRYSDHMTPELRGEVRLDRARALVAQNNLTGARQDLDQALALVSADPMAWYLSAALARRQGDRARARTDIARARELARDNPEILLMAGTIAGENGDMAEAERLYRQVADSAGGSEAGRSARTALATLRETEVAAPAASPTPPPAAPRQPN